MGIFTRLTDIIQANVSAALDKAEDPEKLIRLMVQEMEEALVEMRSTTASLIAEKKSLQRKIDKQGVSVNYWQEQARKAVLKEREDLAKAALKEKHKAEKEIELISPELTRIDEMLSKISHDSHALQDKLKQAKQKLNEFQVRTQSANVRVQVKAKLHSEQIDQALERFAEIEQKVDRIEAQVESYEVVKKSSLEQAFDDLEKDETVEAELQAMKKELHDKAA